MNGIPNNRSVYVRARLVCIRRGRVVRADVLRAGDEVCLVVEARRAAVQTGARLPIVIEVYRGDRLRSCHADVFDLSAASAVRRAYRLHWSGECNSARLSCRVRTAGREIARVVGVIAQAAFDAQGRFAGPGAPEPGQATMAEFGRAIRRRLRERPR